MDYKDIRDLLTVLLPIGIVCFSMAFVKFVFIKEEGSAFIKAGRFFAGAIFGIVVGYVDSKFYDLKWALIIAPIATLVGDSAINWTTKMGWTTILKYIKIRIGSDKSDQNGK